MSIPKERIWQELRSACLDAIPKGSQVSPTNPVSLQSWQKRGCYVVRSVSGKQFDLEASTIDFGNALLTDAELLLNSACEHQVMLWKHIQAGDWMSPAWVSVTTYYWAYYLTLAITRLTGNTAWFLTNEIVTDFKSLGPASPRAPGAGCFRFRCGTQTSVTERELLLKKSNNRIHDEIWRILFTNCRELFESHKEHASTSLETRMYMAITRTANRLGDDWPSAFRNLVNYRSGFAYTASQGKRVLRSIAYLKSVSHYESEQLVGFLEDSAVAANGKESLLDTPQYISKLLMAFTFTLHALASELHNELTTRHGLDTRWKAGRTRFLKSHGLGSNGNIWPS